MHQGSSLVRLTDDHWLQVVIALVVGDFDVGRDQYRTHVFHSNFSYFELPDTEPLIEHHLHLLQHADGEKVLQPHLHVRHPDRPRQHIYVGRSCMEDLLEYLLVECGVPPKKHAAFVGGPVMSDAEALERAIEVLDEGRRIFHEHATWHNSRQVSDFPPEIQRHLV